MKQTATRFEFVEYLPDKMEEGVLYISLPYATAAHNCFCGCGQKVVTPFSPTDWTLIFDGAVSLRPSIGNWGFACQSHYWITKNKVEWDKKMSPSQIESVRRADRLAKKNYYGEAKASSLLGRLSSRKRPKR